MSQVQEIAPEAGKSSKAPVAVLADGMDRLEAIARGEQRESVIHRQIYDDQPVVEIEHFSLWYGQKQALFDVTMPIPKGRVTAIIGPSGCGK